jgi:hypothetical protein
MESIISDGDYAVTKLLNPQEKLNIGDVLQVEHPSLGTIVKCVKNMKDEKILLSGTSLVSSEPTTIGWIHKSKVVSRLFLKITTNGISSIKSCSQGQSGHFY